LFKYFPTTSTSSSHSRDYRELWKEALLEHPVEIDIELVSESPVFEEISLATEAIFLNPSESLVDVLPGFWRSYFANKNGEAQAEPEFTERIYRVGDGISAPTLLKLIAPEYSEPARQAGFVGHVTGFFHRRPRRQYKKCPGG
jgi:hypothetical protein